MEIFNKVDAAGTLVIDLDDTDPVTLKFSRKIVVRVIFGSELPMTPCITAVPSAHDAVNHKNTEVTREEMETLNSESYNNVSIRPELNESLSSYLFDNENEESTAMFAINHSQENSSVDKSEIKTLFAPSIVKEHDVEGTMISSDEGEVDEYNDRLGFEMSDSESVSAMIDSQNDGCESISPGAHVVRESNAQGLQANTAEDKLKSLFGKKGQRCKICKKLFNDKYEFSKHHMIANTKRKCSECGKMCQSKANLLLHEQIFHSSQRNRNGSMGSPLECPICHDSCKGSNVLSHVRTTHTNEALYECCDCHKKFQSYLNLKSHFKIHGVVSISKAKSIKRVEPKRNEVLENRIKNKSEMNRQNISFEKVNNTKQFHHTPNVQAENRIDRSEVTHLQFDTKRSLYRRSPDWTKALKCEYCERLFKTNGEYINHLRPSEIVEMCEECHHGASSKALIMIHQYQKHIKGTDRDAWKNVEGKIFCHICGESSSVHKLLDHIMTQHTSEVPYHCCRCGKPSQTYDSWVEHGKVHQKLSDHGRGLQSDLAVRLSMPEDEDSGKLICRLCKEHFHCERDLISHHQNETERKVCGICNTSSHTKAGFIVHRYVNHGLSPGEDTNGNLCEEKSPCNDKESASASIKCPCCIECFPVNDLLSHIIESHTYETSFRCCSCSSIFTSKDQYLSHCDYHLGKVPYGSGMCFCQSCKLCFESRIALKTHQHLHKSLCPYCSDEFSTKYLLKVHLQNNHSRDMMSCEICGKMYHSLAQFAEHKRHHYYQKQSQCPICGILVYKLDLHMQQHKSSDEKTFFCEICSAQFFNKAELTRHMLKHGNALTEKALTCDICKKTLKNRDTLATHAKVHLKERKMYECQICGKKCAERFNLRTHMRIHKSEKAFKCDLCDQGFNYNQSLQTHIKSKHGKVKDKS